MPLYKIGQPIVLLYNNYTIVQQLYNLLWLGQEKVQILDFILKIVFAFK